MRACVTSPCLFFSFFPRWHHRCRWPQLHQTQTSPKSKTIFDHLAAVARTLNIRRPFFLSCPMCWVKGFLRPTEARQFKADVLFCFSSFYLFHIQLNFEMKCWPVKTVCSWYDLTGIVLRQQKASGSLNKKNKIFKEIDKKKKRTLHFLLNYLPFLFCWPCWTINATRPSRTEEFRTWLEDKKKKHFFFCLRDCNHTLKDMKKKKKCCEKGCHWKMRKPSQDGWFNKNIAWNAKLDLLCRRHFVFSGFREMTCSSADERK